MAVAFAIFLGLLDALWEFTFSDFALPVNMEETVNGERGGPDDCNGNDLNEGDTIQEGMEGNVEVRVEGEGEAEDIEGCERSKVAWVVWQGRADDEADMEWDEGMVL